MPKSDLIRSAHDAALNSTTVKIAPTATAGLGLNELFGWVESGVAFAATVMGLMVTIALWRKLRLERREVELRVKTLEAQLEERDREG